MKIALCCIGRLENRYAVEFVEHYKRLGVDKIFIGDNNRKDEEHFEDVLKSYIDENFVNIIDVRNKPAYQSLFYMKCYQKYHNDFDYMMFFDFDEFLILNKDNNIKDYLTRNICNYDVILVHWVIFTDNDLVYDDGRGCLERFTVPSFSNCITVKSIIKCKSDIITFGKFSHAPIDKQLKFCDNNFKELYQNDDYNFIWNGPSDLTYESIINDRLAYIKHFQDKTIEEYVKYKLKRGVGDRTYDAFKSTYNVDQFFIVNKKTPEKLKYLEEHNIKLR